MCRRIRNPSGHHNIRLADHPAAFVKGEFVGGSDMAMEMYESGELQQLPIAEFQRQFQDSLPGTGWGCAADKADNIPLVKGKVGYR